MPLCKHSNELPFSLQGETEYMTDGGAIIARSYMERDLGTYITSELRWNANVNCLRSKTWKKSTLF